MMIEYPSLQTTAGIFVKGLEGFYHPGILLRQRKGQQY